MVQCCLAKNGGTPSSVSDDQYCLCASGFTGSHCQSGRCQFFRIIRQKNIFSLYFFSAYFSHSSSSPTLSLSLPFILSFFLPPSHPPPPLSLSLSLTPCPSLFIIATLKLALSLSRSFSLSSLSLSLSLLSLSRSSSLYPSFYSFSLFSLLLSLFFSLEGRSITVMLLQETWDFHSVLSQTLPLLINLAFVISMRQTWPYLGYI